MLKDGLRDLKHPQVVLAWNVHSPTDVTSPPSKSHFFHDPVSTPSTHTSDPESSPPNSYGSKNSTRFMRRPSDRSIRRLPALARAQS